MNLNASEEQRDTILAKLTEAGGRIRVRNAMNPILWLCALVATPCFAIICWHPSPHPIVPFLLCAVVGVALLAFVFLLFWDRDRLHSEEYLIRSRTLDLIEEKGSKKAIDGAMVTAISKDEFLSLPETKQLIGGDE